MIKSSTIAVDLAKSVFEVAVSPSPGKVAKRHRLSRTQFFRFIAEQQPTTIVMEACGMAHFWGREAEARGHRAVLLPPHAVRPYVPRNKTDRTDARGLLEAVRNESIFPVPVKSVDQQSLMALHRMRSAWVATRTARMNTVRGILREFGVLIPAGTRAVVPKVYEVVEDADSGLSRHLQACLTEAAREIRDLEGRLHSIELEIAAIARTIPTVERLRSIPGIGLLTATALVAFVGDVRRFPTARHFASYLGLTPRESSSGLRRCLGSISKRGDVYLRTLLIHGARSVLWNARRRASPGHLRAWAMQVENERGHNKAAVALANKLARIAWAVWNDDHGFCDSPRSKRAAVA
jgi:transposase